MITYIEKQIVALKSAYKVIHKQHNRPNESIWTKLWKWPLAEKVKFFLWQVVHGRVLTNSLGAKREFTNDLTCPFDCQSEESVMHIICDYEIPKSVWKCFICPNIISAFVSLDLQGWIWWNAKHGPGCNRVKQWPWF